MEAGFLVTCWLLWKLVFLVTCLLSWSLFWIPACCYGAFSLVVSISDSIESQILSSFGCYGSLFLVYLFVVMELVFLITCLLLWSLFFDYLLVVMEHGFLVTCWLLWNLFSWLPVGCSGVYLLCSPLWSLRPLPSSSPPVPCPVISPHRRNDLWSQHELNGT